MRPYAVLIGLLALLSSTGSLSFAQESVGPSAISGTIWNDVNLDGVRQAEEAGLAMVSVRLSGPRSDQVLTDRDGTYRFEGLFPGQYVLHGGFGTFAIGTFPVKGAIGEVSRAISLNEAPVDDVDFGLTTAFPTVSGTAWVNGTEANNPVIAAWVGETQCGFVAPGIVRPTDTGPSLFNLFFLPPGLHTTCQTGADVFFTINGVAARETIPYPSIRDHGSGGIRRPNPEPPVFVTLTVGPPSAIYTGERPFLIKDDQVVGFPPGDLRALINGTDCGIPQFAFGPVRISVLSAELRAGCGVEGAPIDFYFGDVRVAETYFWTPGFHDFTLTLPRDKFVPPPGTEQQPASGGSTRVTPPDTGDGGLR